MGQVQPLRQLSTPIFHSNYYCFNPLVSLYRWPLSTYGTKSHSVLHLHGKISPGNLPFQRSLGTGRPRITCKMNGVDLTSQLELSEPEERRKKDKTSHGIYWIILLNLGIFVADHLLQVGNVKSLYLHHNWPAWYQFVTATFCHASWSHLSSNLFFVYIFGKLVEEEEGSFGLWLSYIFTGFGANLVSWLVLPRNAVSVGASGAVFGLFAISVLVKMSWDWRKVLEVLILGQFVVEKVMEAAKASAVLSGTGYGGHPLSPVNHIAHLSGALVGIILVWVLSRLPTECGTEAHSVDGKLT